VQIQLPQNIQHCIGNAEAVNHMKVCCISRDFKAIFLFLALVPCSRFWPKFVLLYSGLNAWICNFLKKFLYTFSVQDHEPFFSRVPDDAVLVKIGCSDVQY